MKPLFDLSATEMGPLFASGDLSPVDVLESVLARVDSLDGTLHATFSPLHDEARLAAQASEQRWRSGNSLGPLDGVPATVKDQIALVGTQRVMGTAATQPDIDTLDGPSAARLREAGAIIFAKTTMPDYGMLSSGLSSYHLLTCNPWDTSKTAGGSSSGAGAAAAAGYGPLHVGTDIGGSIRLPASWCGIFGLKPSHGRVPIDPPYMGRVAGPMTRTVADSALIMSVISRPDPRDFMSLPPADIPWLDLDCDVKGMKIGLMLEAGCGSPLDPQVAAAVSGAAKLFEDHGAIVEPVNPFMTQDMLDGFDQFFRTRFRDVTEKLPREQYEKILPYIRQWVEGATSYDSMTAYRGYSQLVAMHELGVQLSQQFDFIVSPVSPEAAFPAHMASPLDDPQRPFEHIGYTVACNMTQQPAASINCGYTKDGLPIGLHIAGRRFDDIDVLRLAHWFEQVRGPQRAWPFSGLVLATESSGIRKEKA